MILNNVTKTSTQTHSNLLKLTLTSELTKSKLPPRTSITTSIWRNRQIPLSSIFLSLNILWLLNAHTITLFWWQHFQNAHISPMSRPHITNRCFWSVIKTLQTFKSYNPKGRRQKQSSANFFKNPFTGASSRDHKQLSPCPSLRWNTLYNGDSVSFVLPAWILQVTWSVRDGEGENIWNLNGWEELVLQVFVRFLFYTVYTHIFLFIILGVNWCSGKGNSLIFNISFFTPSFQKEDWKNF